MYSGYEIGLPWCMITRLDEVFKDGGTKIFNIRDVRFTKGQYNWYLHEGKGL